MNTQPQLIEFPARGVVAVPDGAGESLLGSDTRPRNYGDEVFRTGADRKAPMPLAGEGKSDCFSPTSSEIEARIDYAVGGFFLGCCVMVGAYIIGILAWRAM